MTSDEYGSDLRELRRLFISALGNGDLPSELDPRQIEPDSQDRECAKKLRDLIIREDSDGLARSASATALAGLNRGDQSPPDDVPELDEARERVRKLRADEDDDAK